LQTNYLKSFQGINTHVWILSASMLVNRVGSMVLAFMSLYLTKELGFSMGQAGLVLGAYGTGSILGSYFGGWLTDRRGYYKILVFSLIGSGLTLLPLLFITDFLAIMFNVFIYAIIADAFRPANSVAVSYYSTDETRTRSISLIRLAINLGFGIGPMIGGLTAAWIGFKWIFLFDAITSLLAGLVIIGYLPHKSALKSDAPRTIPSKSSSVFYDKSFLIFLLMVSLYGIFFFQLFASVPVFFSKNFGYSEDIIGYLLGLNGLLVVLMEMPIIYRIENRFNNASWIAVGCLMMCIAYILLALNYNNLFLCMVYTFFITLSEIFAMPFMMRYTMSKPEPERKGQYLAMYSVAYGLSHIIAPSLGLGFAAAFNFPLFYGLASVASLFLAILFFLIMADGKKK
jgi:predicted MFS family arabinose efflux permease